MRKSPLPPPFPGSAPLQTSLSKPCCRLHAFPQHCGWARQWAVVPPCFSALLTFLLCSVMGSPQAVVPSGKFCSRESSPQAVVEICSTLEHLFHNLILLQPQCSSFCFWRFFSSSFLWGVLLCFLLYSQRCHDLGSGVHSGGTAGMGQPLASSHRSHPTSAAPAASTLPRTPSTGCGIWVVTGFWFPSNDL